MIIEGGSTAGERIAWAFRRLTARNPSTDELAVLTARYDARLARYQQNSDAAKQLISQGAMPPDSKLDPAELAAFTVTANVLLNLDETVTRE